METEKTKWHRFSGTKIDDLRQTILSDIEKYQNDYELKVIVGADSQVTGHSINFTVAIILLRIGHGGIAYYKNEKISLKKVVHRKRLWEEVLEAVKVAQLVDEFLLEKNLSVSEIHVDLNQNKKFLSSEVVAECLGYIHAYGYQGLAKPMSWAASTVANKKSK